MERKETKLWNLIRTGTKKYSVHWTRIENLVDSGTPDTLGVYKGKYFPIELKVEETTGWVYIRPSQVSWMRLHLLAGGQPWLLYRELDETIVLIKVNLDFLSLLTEKKVHSKTYLAFSTDVFKGYARFTKPYKYEEMLEVLIGEIKYA